MNVKEYVITALASLVVIRGVIDSSFSSEEVGLVLGLLGIIPVTRADRKRHDNG